MELNWLPDHLAISSLVKATGPRLDNAVARDLLRRNLGFIPAAIDPTQDMLIWVDVADYDLQEWQFIFSIKNIVEQHKDINCIATNLDILMSDEWLGESVPVSGFIFHMSRCGSTLLGNALASCHDHLSINQPGPLQEGFWAVLTDQWSALPMRANSERYVVVLRHLIRAILRRRRASYLRGFIKFRSWSVLFLNFIRTAFPEVPCLFLYRDPVEVLASTLQKKNVVQLAENENQKAFLAGVPKKTMKLMNDVDFLIHCYENYFHSALNTPQNRISYLNYDNLDENRLNHIIHNAFNINATKKALQG